MLLVFVLASGLLTVGGIGPGAARAESLTIQLADLGRADELSLGAPPSSQTVTLPVPPGMRPARLRGTIEVAVGGPGGILEVTGTRGRLASIDLRGKNGADVSMAVDLSRLPITDNAVAVTFRLGDPDNRCVDDTTEGTVVRNLRVDYDGTDTPPTTIADFLPPTLHELTVAVPADADLSVRDAAVQLASGIAARYRPAAPTVRVIALPASGVPGPDAALHRTVAFTGVGEAELELGADRVLLINGSGSLLGAQVGALFGDLGAIAVASSAINSRPQAVPQLPPDTQTLEQLGLGGPSATGRGSAAVRMGVEASALGQPATSWTVHLVGTVVAGGVGTDSRRGSLTLTVGSRILGNWPLAGDGAFDHAVTLPRDLIGRYNELVLTAVADGTYDCGARPVVTVDVDPASTIAAEPAEQPAAVDFADLPAVLRPSYQVATDSVDVPGLAQVVALAVALQRLSGPTLVPTLVEPDTLMSGSDAGLLIVHGLPPTEADLPLDLTAETATLPDGRQLTADTRQATLQLGSINSRSVAVVSGTDAGLVDGLLSWLGHSDNLGALSGDVAVWSGREPVSTLSLRAATTEDAVAARGWVVAVIAAAVFAVILAAVVATTMLVRRRRSRQHGEPGPDDDPPGDDPVIDQPDPDEPGSGT